MRYSGAKGKAWESVRRYVKKKETDCYTCSAKDLEGRNFQCGHYFPVAITGSNNRLTWDPRFIHAQCSRCNGAGQGMQSAYKEHLIREYGQEVVDEFEERRRKVDPIKNFNEIIEHFDYLLEIL